MRSLKEFRNKAYGLPDLLPWAALVDNGVVLNKNGSLMAGFYYTGPDLDSATNAELAAMSNRINTALSLGDGWVLNCDAIRIPAPGYAAEARFPDRTTRLIDDVRRARFESESAGYTSRFALTVTWFPAPDAATKAGSFLVDGGEKSTPGGDNLQRFQERIHELQGRLSGFLKIRRMEDIPDARTGEIVNSEILQYLEYCVSFRNRPFRLSMVPMYLDSVLGRHELVTGFNPRIDNQAVAALAIEGFPAMTSPGILDFLSRLPVSYRWSNRFIYLDPIQAEKEINRYRSRWSQKRKSALNVIRESQGGQATHINIHADQQTNDTVVAMAEASSGAVRFGYYTSVILLAHESEKILMDTAREVQKVIENHGFGVRIEDVNAVEALMGSMPGNTYANVRRPLIHTLNLAHLLPFTSVWPGPDENSCPFYPPHSAVLMHANTDGSTPFRISLHAGDIGHSVILGPTGCHAKGHPILLANGQIRPVEDLRVGDQVMGPDSKPRRVLRLHRGIAGMYRITPVKGEPFTVNGDHILALKRMNDGTQKAGGITCLTVKEYLSKSDTFKHLHKLYRAPVIEFHGNDDQVRLPVSPYLLGVYLGDGAAGNASITNPDPEIADALYLEAANGGFAVQRRKSNSSGVPRFGINHGFKGALKTLGIESATAAYKFVPLAYKTGPWEIRLEILAGLLDTDGSLSQNGFDYISKSRQLADDVTFMARSLGLAAYRHESWKSCQSFAGESRQYWRVFISGNTDIVPTRVARKQARPRRQIKDVLITGFTVEADGADAYYGFELNDDHLYLDGYFTVHHNSGKSTILSMTVAQQFRYPNAQVFAFDKGYSMLPLVAAAGGQHYDIAGDAHDLAFCPMGMVDKPSEQSWAAEWVEGLVNLQGIAVTPRMRDEIYRAIVQLGTSTTEMRQRTLGSLVTIIQDDALRGALNYYTLKGPAGHLLDAENDGLGEDIFQVFEMEHLMNLGEKILLPTLLYLFHRIEQRFRGQPTLLVLDEAWVMLGHDVFRAKIREWLKVLRKANVAVVFATQSLSDLIKSGIADVIFESCPTRILLPNPEAMTDQSRPLYESVGLNPRQIEILANAIPKRQYYMMHPDGRRLFELGLSGPELAFVGASGKEDLARIRELRDLYGWKWPAQWLRERGQTRAAELWDSY